MPDGMNHEYIIYEWGTGANKNLEKLIKAIVYIQSKGTNIMLYVIWDELVKDLQLREYMVQNNATNYIRFLWQLEETEKPIYYTKALWVILPSLYESFPFTLSNAVLYNKKIITSNIKALRELFWDTVEYFNPLSINQLSEKLLWIKNQPEPDYTSILEKFTARKSAEKLLFEIEN
jgi:glycosyltransferase involved in cell wall biosynthesis